MSSWGWGGTGNEGMTSSCFAVLRTSSQEKQDGRGWTCGTHEASYRPHYPLGISSKLGPHARPLDSVRTSLLTSDQQAAALLTACHRSPNPVARRLFVPPVWAPAKGPGSVTTDLSALGFYTFPMRLAQVLPCGIPTDQPDGHPFPSQETGGGVIHLWSLSRVTAPPKPLTIVYLLACFFLLSEKVSL